MESQMGSQPVLEYVGLDEVCDGKLKEMFAEAMREVALDVADARKPKKAKRKITFTLELDFDQNGRAAVSCNYDVKKPAAEKITADGRIYVSTKPGKPVVVSAFKPEMQESLPMMQMSPTQDDKRIN